MRVRVAGDPSVRPERKPRLRVYASVPCPHCGGTHARALSSWSRRARRKLTGRAILRQYRCEECGRSFYSIEYAVVSEADLARADAVVA